MSPLALPTVRSSVRPFVHAVPVLNVLGVVAAAAPIAMWMGSERVQSHRRRRCARAQCAHMVPCTAHMTQTGGVQDRYVGRARRARQCTGATEREGEG